ncbi:MAG: recombinase family protein [Clostridia bacterium]|nr:recombinase family protein [Clostridia bacterium]
MARKSRRINQVNQVPQVITPEPSETMPKYNVAIYLRVSNEESARTVGTIEFQKQIALEYMKNRTDMVLYDIYIDNGRTGTNFDREGFQQMMYDVYNGKVNCIIVKDLSRFGREYIGMGEYVDKIFPLLGIRFIAINDCVDNMVAPCDVTVPIKNVINALYAKDTSRKIASAFRTKQLNGEYTGGMGPYGYTVSEEDRDKLVVDPEAANVVKMIFKWKLEGLGVVTICRMLVSMGIVPPAKYKYDRGVFKNKKFANMKFWSESMIVRILANEVYTGNMVQGRTKRSLYNNIPLRRVDKEDWIIVENTHEAIVSKEDFNAVQEMMAQYNRKPRVRKTNKKENILKGLVVCGDCGYRMVRGDYKDREKGTPNYYFVCRQHSVYPESCQTTSIKEDVLKSIVHQSIKMQIMTLSKIEESMLVASTAPETKHAMYSLTKQISETLSNIAYIKESRVRIATDFARQMIDEEEYNILRDQLAIELQNAAEKLEVLEHKRDKFNKLFSADRWISELKQYSSTKKLSAAMVNEFIKSIKVYPDKRIEIEGKHQDTIAEYLEILNGGE